MKIETKRCFTENFNSCIADKFVGTHFSDFTKKNEKGKEKVIFQGEGIQKVVVQLPYTWGYLDSINRIRRSKLKVKIVVEVGGNQKAISGGMGRVYQINILLSSPQKRKQAGWVGWRAPTNNILPCSMHFDALLWL